MKKIMKRTVALVLLLALTLSVLPQTTAAAADTSKLGKLADLYTARSETFTLTAASHIFVASETAPTGALLQTVQLIQQQFAADGYTMDLVWGPATWAKAGDIVIVLDSALAAESYRLDVSGTAFVTAGDVDGLLYGANMLLKHFRYGGSTIQGFTMSDAPDTKQRAVSLDCGRKYYSKDWICNFIRQMSWMGYNTLELHFSDDSGFRIDLWDEAYYKDANGDGTVYKPANDFSWICGSNYTSWTLTAYQNDVDKGKYLTTAELVEILETAAAYHIDVIPAFDSPSHVDYLTWTFEQNYKSNTGYSFYSTYDKKTYYASDVKGIINYTNSSGWSTALKWPYYAAINIKGAQAKAFIFELYIDIANFFKEYSDSTDFSVGADEVQLSTANLASGYRYAWGFSDFVSYINELNKLLNGKGYTMRMYNDFMGSISYNASNYTFDNNIEILYWDSPFNPSASSASNHTQPVSYYVNKGMTVYNCIQTNTYYALRITSGGSDARSVYNRQWTFYHANEEDIYNEWYSADISEHGDYSEDVADVPEANLGGAYFLIWCDYACVSTEAEIWNGVYDKTTQNTGEFYSLLDRMWSNTIKMWNWDINSTVTYSTYKSIREKFGYFPGFESCSAMTTLPTAATPAQAYLADHTALTAALANKIAKGDYTNASYAAYEAAYAAAEAVNARHDATAAELAAQVEALAAAEAALVVRGFTLTVNLKTTVDGMEKLLGTITKPLDDGDNSYEIYLPPMTGYTFEKTAGTIWTPLASGDGSGFVRGVLVSDAAVTVWYTNTPDTSRLNDLINEAVTAQGNYTAASWNAYQDAITKAKNFTADETTRQADIDAMTAAIMAARTGLVTAADSTQIIEVEKLTGTATKGKLVGLRVTTSADVTALTVEDRTLSLYTAAVQTLDSGETVKIWLIGFPADEIGEFSYTITATGTETATETVTITVQ